MFGNYCWWSVGDGHHGKMLRSTVKSMKEHNIEGDIHLWTDRDDIEGAVIHHVDTNSFDKKHYLFKVEFLQREVAKLDYDYFIFMDADTYFVRELPYDPLIMMQGSPIHSFLESKTYNPENVRFDWWGCWIPRYEELMRECGVISMNVYNVNAGLWIVQKEAINTICSLMRFFWTYCKDRGHTFTEEAPLAYATHMLCADAEAHQIYNFSDIWASDWTGHFNNRLPVDEPWNFVDYFTNKPVPVQPAIVHAMRSKGVLAS